jgi:hypothetical protein
MKNATNRLEPHLRLPSRRLWRTRFGGDQRGPPGHVGLAIGPTSVQTRLSNIEQHLGLAGPSLPRRRYARAETRKAGGAPPSFITSPVARPFLNSGRPAARKRQGGHDSPAPRAARGLAREASGEVCRSCFGRGAVDGTLARGRTRSSYATPTGPEPGLWIAEGIARRGMAQPQKRSSRRYRRRARPPAGCCGSLLTRAGAVMSWASPRGRPGCWNRSASRPGAEAGYCRMPDLEGQIMRRAASAFLSRLGMAVVLK